MGVSELEARFLSRQAGTKKISRPLRHTAQHSRSEFYLSATGERNNHPELDPEYPGAFPLWNKGSPNHHSPKGAEGYRGLPAALSRDHRALSLRAQAWARAVSTTAQPKGRPRSAQRLPGDSAAHGAGRI